jgi:hypothetical protein
MHVRMTGLLEEVVMEEEGDQAGEAGEVAEEL